MPFPMAHPAAVLPLRRYCPRGLSFPALVIGSLSPDASYVFGEGDMDTFAHEVLGSLGFGLPVGLAMVGLLHLLRTPVVRRLPVAYQQALAPFCRRSLGSLRVILISLWLGIWMHVGWDSFTHNSGWIVQHVSALQAPILSVAGRTARVCHLLWYGCSFAGVVYIVLAFEKWRETYGLGAAGASAKTMLRNAVVVALLVLPIQLVHHVVRGWPGLLMIAVLCALAATAVYWRMAKAPPAALSNEP